MDALDLLRTQAAQADATMLRVFEPVTPEQLVWQLPGSTANTIGATFLHAYYSADNAISRATHAPTVLETGGWGPRLGYDPSAAWRMEGRRDPADLRAYAEAVIAATKSYLAGLAPGQLEQETEGPGGRRTTLAGRLSVYFVFHKFQHMGDIAALLGCQGVKGLPF